MIEDLQTTKSVGFAAGADYFSQRYTPSFVLATPTKGGVKLSASREWGAFAFAE